MLQAGSQRKSVSCRACVEWDGSRNGDGTATTAAPRHEAELMTTMMRTQVEVEVDVEVRCDVWTGLHQRRRMQRRHQPPSTVQRFQVQRRRLQIKNNTHRRINACELGEAEGQCEKNQRNSWGGGAELGETEHFDATERAVNRKNLTPTRFNVVRSSARENNEIVKVT